MLSEKQFLQLLLDDCKDATTGAWTAVNELGGGYDDGGEGMYSYDNSVNNIRTQIKYRLQKLNNK